MGRKVTITGFDYPGTDRTKLYLTWSFTANVSVTEKGTTKTFGTSTTTTGYSITWIYTDQYLRQHVEYTTVSGYNNCYTEFDLPSRTLEITAYVTPTSNTYPHYKKVHHDAVKYTSGSKKGQIKTKAYDEWQSDGTKSFYTGEQVSIYKMLDYAYLPAKADAPSASIENNKITATVNSSDPNSQEIEFSLWVNNAAGPYATVMAFSMTNSYSCTFDVGGLSTNTDYYSIRARGVFMSDLFGEYSDFSSALYPLPSSPTNTKAVPFGDAGESIKMTWNNVATATDYEVEYATLLDSLNAGNGNTKSSDTNSVLIEGLDSGHTYYLRVRSNNNRGSDRKSGWSNPIACILGKKPDPPYTYAYKNRIKTTEKAELYWIHSSRDSSLVTWYQLMINGVALDPVKDTRTDEQKSEAMRYEYTHGLSAGGEFTWCVRTKGVLGSSSGTSEEGWSDYSTVKTVKVYNPPSCTISKISTSSYPLKFKAVCGPTTQQIMTYDVKIVNTVPRYANNNKGEIEYISSGYVMYSKHGVGSDFIQNGSSYEQILTMECKDFDICLTDGTYNLIFTVYMNTGLSGEVEQSFTTSFNELSCIIDAGISISASMPTIAFITPYAEDADGNRLQNISMSLYRVELDGTLVAIEENFDNSKSLTITDPHVNLDFARYRIVAKDKVNGGIAFTTVETPVDGINVIIQWDEFKENLDGSLEGYDNLFGVSQWDGTSIAIPTNITISNSYNMDTNLVEYIGRKHPVGYYGTQLGETATWNVEIPKYDTDTLNKIRQLAVYTGNVYVREPNGTGYWAHVVPSFNINYNALTVPITFNITRVEGDG